jgi:hypothetical protein
MSDRIDLPHDNEGSPGSWKFAGKAVIIRCGLCGNRARMRDAPDDPIRKDGTRGHTIADDGTVMPSVVCPHQGCTWHVWVRLLDWKA